MDLGGITGAISRSVRLLMSGSAGLICDQSFRIGIFNQVLGASQIVDLRRRQHQIGRIAEGINEGVSFRCKPTTRSTDSLVTVFS
jgi:hypothetical protein